MTRHQDAKILYELDRQGLIKIQGATIDEVAANIAKAHEIIIRTAESQSVNA